MKHMKYISKAEMNWNWNELKQTNSTNSHESAFLVLVQKVFWSSMFAYNMTVAPYYIYTGS